MPVACRSRAPFLPIRSRQGLLKFQLADGSTQTLTAAEVRQVDPLRYRREPQHA